MIPVFFLSCLDTINIDLPNDEAGRLVIDGLVERSPDIYRFVVNVSRTRDLNTEGIDNLESATILLLYNGTPIFELVNGEEDTISIVAFHEQYGGNLEEAYFNIRVLTPDGNMFESESQKILNSPKESSIKLSYEIRAELNDRENVVQRGYVKVGISTPIINQTGERVSFRWDVSGVYEFREVAWTDDPFVNVKTCYVKDFLPGNKVNVLKSSEISGDYITDFEIAALPGDHKFASGYYFTVVQKTLDEAAAIYWDRVRQSIDREGTIFDAPVGANNSNIQQVSGDPVEVLGYFYTAGVDTLRHLSTREETGKQLHLCAYATVSDACCDCLLLVNSSLSKPLYWQ
ncbi:MAG: DUF4249 family protein [Saprospiraceae bacterium]|nr:DUF4249 family protein [Saprospiraceae bacterium]